MTETRLIASVSCDLDNLWCYLKAHGDPAWQQRPSYLDSVVPIIIDLFGEQKITSTVFVVGADAVREDGARAVAAIAAAGHEVGNHSFEHEPWLHRYSQARLDDELAGAEDAIQAAGAPRPTGFRGPGFSISPTLVELLKKRGYRYDASMLPTWIGPILRAYYFKGTRLSAEEQAERGAMFGGLIDGLRPIRPFMWEGGQRQDDQLLEIPVTTFPLFRVPIHVSYVMHLHQISPALAKAYFRAAVRACMLAKVGPSILIHPTDVLDIHSAPGMGFFPSMNVPAAEKRSVVSWVLSTLSERFEVVGTGEHARRLVGGNALSRRTSVP